MVRKIFYSENADVYPGITARNNAVLDYEKFIHRTFYPYIVHPYSKFRIKWQTAFLIIIPFRLITVCLFWTLFSHHSWIYHVFVFLFQLINLGDVIFQFFTGYVEENSEITVLDPKRIMQKYILSYFIVDIIPCLPISFVCYLLRTYMSANIHPITLEMSRITVVLRLFRFYKYMSCLSKIMMWNPFSVGLKCVYFSVFSIFMYVNDFKTLTSLVQVSNLFDMENPHDQIGDNDFLIQLQVFVEMLLSFMLCTLYYSHTENKYPSIDEGNFVVICMVILRGILSITIFFCLVIFATYFIKYLLIKHKATRRGDLEVRVLSFIKKNKLSKEIKNKTLLYFRILLENRDRRDEEIFNYIPDTFKADIFHELCLPLLKNFYAFESLSTYILRRLAECMKYQLFLPNEVIKKDENDGNMYFVGRGTVAWYSDERTELYHFETGSCFNGKNTIIGKPPYKGFAIAIEVAEIYRLNRDSFLLIMSTYPRLFKIVQERVREEKLKVGLLFE